MAPEYNIQAKMVNCPECGTDFEVVDTDGKKWKLSKLALSVPAHTIGEGTKLVVKTSEVITQVEVLDEKTGKVLHLSNEELWEIAWKHHQDRKDPDRNKERSKVVAETQ